ncbi:MAG: hypothetical protein AAF725_22350 [Acidobacteriota bacterium]
MTAMLNDLSNLADKALSLLRSSPIAIEPAALPLLLGGAALLLFGRRLYWLAVGGLGAALAVTLAGHLALASPEARLLLAAAAAVVGAILALTAQRLVVSAVGFLTGAAFGVWLTPLIWPAAADGLWLIAAAVLAGLLGLLLASKVFEGLLIVGTSAAGAWLILDAVPQLAPYQAWALPLGVALGVALQSRWGSGRERKKS